MSAPDMLATLRAVESDLMAYVDRLRKDGPRMALSYAAAQQRLADLRALIASLEG